MLPREGGADERREAYRRLTIAVLDAPRAGQEEVEVKEDEKEEAPAVRLRKGGQKKVTGGFGVTFFLAGAHAFPDEPTLPPC